jgi:geranylgeranyl pyrophosphate synthase
MGRSAIPEPVTAVTELAGAWLPARLAEVEARLERLVAAQRPPLAHDAAETLAAGGKRMRPLLVLLCAGPSADEGALSAATAIELVHMATLVHDDVLDAAPLRRGRPTVVATSGRERALATGDLLFSLAFALLASDDAGAGGSGADRVARVRALTEASAALASGELMQRSDAFDLTVGADRYLRRCILKTAALFECACVIGRRRPEAETRALRHFGREIGLAFQLLDDVLDVAGPPERTGKARGTDLLDGTVTLPLIRAIERDPALGHLDLRTLDHSAAERACDAIAATGALDEVRADARARVEKAKRELAGAGLSPDELRLLAMVADGVVERYS